jgi:chromosome partitioning protein
MSTKHPPTHVLAFACSKGGVGKSTLATTLAVRAAAETRRVAVVDLDPQESALSWGDRRKCEPAVKVIDAEQGVASEIARLRKEHWAWVFVDTPPSRLELIEPGIAVADLVLIPCRPSALDIDQVDIAVQLAEKHGKPYAFMLNHAPGNWKLTQSSAALLRKGGRIVLDPPIMFRMSYMAAMTVGKSAAEVDPDGKTGAEIDELWDGLKAVVARTLKVTA